MLSESELYLKVVPMDLIIFSCEEAALEVQMLSVSVCLCVCVSDPKTEYYQE